MDIGSSVASREELGFYDCPGPPPKLLALFGYCMLELKEALFDRASGRRAPSPWALAGLGDHPRI